MNNKFYCLIFALSTILISEERLKQARVTEYFATQTIDYVESLRENGDSKEYLFIRQTNAYLARAKAHLELGKMELALEDINKVIVREPYRLESYYYRGRIFSILEKYFDAKVNYDVVIDNELFSPDVFAYRAEAKFNIYRDESILIDIDDFINNSDKSHPYSGKLHFYKGAILFQKENYSDALENLHIAIELSPEIWEAYMIRGNIYRIQGQLTPAFSDLNIAVNSKQCPREVYLYRGMANSFSGNFQLAINDLTQFLMMTPEYHQSKPEAILQRAIARFYRGNLNEALNDLNEVIKREPTHWLAFRLLGLVYLEKKEFYKSLTNFNIAFERGDHDVELFLQRGIVHLNLSHYKSAESDFSVFLNKARDNHTRYGKVLCDRGIALFFMKRIEDACIDWNYASNLQYEDANKFIQMHCVK